MPEHERNLSGRITRRALTGASFALAGLAGMRTASAAGATLPEVRLGVLQFGTVQWVADTIRRHNLDERHGFSLRQIVLANTDAGRVAIMADANDVIVSDWPFVAVQRTTGTKLSFAPFSSSSGAIMTSRTSSIQGLSDLRGRKLGVVGGPVDKSWLVVQAAARAAHGIDLATEAQVVFGAPPLLGAKLRQGELEAVLTFWNFAAKLEAVGFREVVSVAQCAGMLGLSPRLSLVGFVFHETWADANRPVIDGFLAAVDDANSLLAQSDAEWQAIRPLMDAADETLFTRLRERFRAGAAHEDAAGQAKEAARLFAILRDIGGARATGGIDVLPPGIFWPVRDGAS